MSWAAGDEDRAGGRAGPGLGIVARGDAVLVGSDVGSGCVAEVQGAGRDRAGPAVLSSICPSPLYNGQSACLPTLHPLGAGLQRGPAREGKGLAEQSLQLCSR